MKIKKRVKGFDQEKSVKGISSLRSSLIEAQKQALLASDSLENTALFGNNDGSIRAEQIESINSSASHISEASQAIQDAIQATRSAKESLSFNTSSSPDEMAISDSVPQQKARTLRARRDRARLKQEEELFGAKLSTKTFNMRWINDSIDAVIAELGEYADREPELYAAIQALVASKRLVSAYSERTVNSPHRSKAIPQPDQLGKLAGSVLEELNEFIDDYNEVAMASPEVITILEESVDYGLPSKMSDYADDISDGFQQAVDALGLARVAIMGFIEDNLSR